MSHVVCDLPCTTPLDYAQVSRKRSDTKTALQALAQGFTADLGVFALRKPGTSFPEQWKKGLQLPALRWSSPWWWCSGATLETPAKLQDLQVHLRHCFFAHEMDVTHMLQEPVGARQLFRCTRIWALLHGMTGLEPSMVWFLTLINVGSTSSHRLSLNNFPFHIVLLKGA